MKSTPEAPMMPYANLSGASGVRAYQISARAISVKFGDGRVYDYSYTSAGPDKVEQMKTLARAGQGLSTYISQHVRDGYASRRDP
jgi:hypothetical protein